MGLFEYVTRCVNEFMFSFWPYFCDVVLGRDLDFGKVREGLIWRIMNYCNEI